MSKKKSLLVVFLVLLSSMVSAQTRREVLKAKVDSTLHVRYNKVDSALLVRYNKVNYDTLFIGRPQARLTLKLRANIAGTSIHARGEVRGAYTKADLRTDVKATMSIGVNYRGITAGLAINPSRLRGKNNDYEFNLNAYSNRYSIDASYQMSKTMAGKIVRDGVRQKIERGLIDTKIVNITGYYTFNYRRFSYPAAFSQSYIQKRSAGSWLVGFAYQGGRLKTIDENKPEDIPDARFYVGHFGIGGGYGYNLVLGTKWLLHASTLPTLVLLNGNNQTINDERKDMETNFPDIILNERVAIVRNFSTKYFMGLTVVMSNSIFNSNHVDINQNKWFTRAFFGVRL